MRELRENVRYRPARDRYKVFIIDEAHQITSETFNAMLKTLEEPPEWVVFVLCTTEAHKIPATISSRCQHFSFRSVDFDDVVARLEYIAQQEGIQADAEALAVLAQAGEGSVRDSLSALDQAIACCGTILNAAQIRALLGAYSIEVLERVAQALLESSSVRMLEVVDELVRSGQHLQHFVRELARFFRNLLVSKIAGGDTRLVAASRQEREKLAAIASQFSEQDLTRYLQLTLDLFRDLQFSLQPRLHVEMGLIRLVEAGKLLPIEEALAALEGGAGPQASPAPRAAPAGGAPASAKASSDTGDWKKRLVAAARELGMDTTADAIEDSQVSQSGGVVDILAPAGRKLFLKDADVQRALKHLGGGTKAKLSFGDPGPVAVPEREAPAPADEASRRAMANPEVQRFRELFPDAEVRVVRDLKQ
jgi:DNA polymerase-3 subunit gamma/tau